MTASNPEWGPRFGPRPGQWRRHGHRPPFGHAGCARPTARRRPRRSTARSTTTSPARVATAGAPGAAGPPFGPGFGPGMGPGFARRFGGPRGRGRRTARGDIRAAVLALVAEQPRHGYEIIQEIAERTGGVWRPSPGSVYPTLSQLEDEGLVRVEQAEGRRVVHLTEEGTRYVEEHRAELDAVWESVGRGADDDASRAVGAARPAARRGPPGDQRGHARPDHRGDRGADRGPQDDLPPARRVGRTNHSRVTLLRLSRSDVTLLHVQGRAPGVQGGQHRGQRQRVARFQAADRSSRAALGRPDPRGVPHAAQQRMPGGELAEQRARHDPDDHEQREQRAAPAGVIPCPATRYGTPQSSANTVPENCVPVCVQRPSRVPGSRHAVREAVRAPRAAWRPAAAAGAPGGRSRSTASTASATATPSAAGRAERASSSPGRAAARRTGSPTAPAPAGRRAR